MVNIAMRCSKYPPEEKNLLTVKKLTINGWGNRDAKCHTLDYYTTYSCVYPDAEPQKMCTPISHVSPKTQKQLKRKVSSGYLADFCLPRGSGRWLWAGSSGTSTDADHPWVLVAVRPGCWEDGHVVLVKINPGNLKFLCHGTQQGLRDSFQKTGNTVAPCDSDSGRWAWLFRQKVSFCLPCQRWKATSYKHFCSLMVGEGQNVRTLPSGGQGLSLQLELASSLRKGLWQLD